MHTPSSAVLDKFLAFSGLGLLVTLAPRTVNVPRQGCWVPQLCPHSLPSFPRCKPSVPPRRCHTSFLLSAPWSFPFLLQLRAQKVMKTLKVLSMTFPHYFSITDCGLVHTLTCLLSSPSFPPASTQLLVPESKCVWHGSECHSPPTICSPNLAVFPGSVLLYSKLHLSTRWSCLLPCLGHQA